MNEEWGMAEEHGRWSGTLMANDGPMELAGVYAAKWHHTAQGWLLQAEIFTPLTVVRGSTRVERSTDPGVPNGIRIRRGLDAYLSY